MNIDLKFTGRQVALIYAAVILLAVVYFVLVESIFENTYMLSHGGRDLKVTFYDFALVVVFAVSAALTYISTLAFLKKRNERLFFVAFAFFLFAIKAALKLIENFVLGPYGYIGITMQTLELLILLSLFFALFKK
jgi:hypothetical protein